MFCYCTSAGFQGQLPVDIGEPFQFNLKLAYGSEYSIAKCVNVRIETVVSDMTDFVQVLRLDRSPLFELLFQLMRDDRNAR